ncbi:MAG: ATP-binding protein [Treponema sp.]|nr:ATP-binding protein [Treponema sp.]
MNRRLPIGIQDFPKIREGGFVYIDKTFQIYRLVSGGEGAFFLSRPRRFGKSLLCSTLGAVFEGRRELFGGMKGQPPLAISGLDWEWKPYPVIRIDLNPGNYSAGIAELHATVKRDLELCAQNYGVPFTGETIADCFARLIQALNRRYNQRAAVIIDEYDKPLLSTIDAPDTHARLRDALKGFYGVLKSSDPYLRFVFLTGVTKFSHVSIFSDLNHLSDLSLDPRYADICGITQEELERNFAPEIEAVLRGTGKSRDAYLDDLRRYYNGYRFSTKPLTMYNPFGLLNHFDKSGEFQSYWYDTGTPAFLVKLIAAEKISILDLNNLRVGYQEFSKFDIETMKAVPVLYQSGYLTIADYDEERNRFALDYPNEEVRSCFARSLLELYLRVPSERAMPLCVRLPDALYDGEPGEALECLRVFFASIPYDIIGEEERYCQTVAHTVFTMLGFNCRSEVRIAAGRIDTLVETKRYVYCFEFKLNGTAEEALAQIDSKEYLLPWKGSGKTLFKVGVVFDRRKRNIGAWKSVCLRS